MNVIHTFKNLLSQSYPNASTNELIDLLVEIGVINEMSLVHNLIRSDIAEMLAQGFSKQVVYEQLGSKYHVSEEQVRYILYQCTHKNITPRVGEIIVGSQQRRRQKYNQ